MVTLTAGSPPVTTSLPNPDFGDTEGLNVQINYREAMDGTPYVYRKNAGSRTITMTWSNLGRGKLVELAEFFKAFIGQTIIINDHEGQAWTAIFDDTSLSINTSKLAQNNPEGRAERGEVTLSFVGAKL
jgi:hypothetical protein